MVVLVVLGRNRDAQHAGPDRDHHQPRGRVSQG